MDIISHISEGFKAHKPASPAARCLCCLLFGGGSARPSPPFSVRGQPPGPLWLPAGAVGVFKSRHSPSFSSEERKPFPACLPRVVSSLAFPGPGPLLFPPPVTPAPWPGGRGALGPAAGLIVAALTVLSPGVLEPSAAGVCGAAHLYPLSLSWGPRVRGWGADCKAHLLPGTGTGLMTFWPCENATRLTSSHQVLDVLR